MDNMDRPSPILVSVIVPAFNAEKTISQAIQSALEQDIDDFEILVIDDGSTDRTAAMIESFSPHPRIRVLRHPEGKNRGVCASRRLALGEARGEWIAFLDADDRYLPGKLKRHLQILRERPELVLIHGAVEWKGPTPDHPGMALAFQLGRESRAYRLSEEPYYLHSNIICNSTVVMRRSAIDVEGFPEAMVFQTEDWVLWNMAASHGLFFYDTEALTEYAFHEHSFTYQNLRRVQTEDLSFIEFYLVVISRLPRAWMRIRAARLLLYRLVSMSKNRLNPSGKPAGSVARSIILGFLTGSLKVWLKSVLSRNKIP